MDATSIFRCFNELFSKDFNHMISNREGSGTGPLLSVLPLNFNFIKDNLTKYN